MRILDLFCGAGGAAMGYHRAGFDVVGVDIKPQPNYPFLFQEGDALEFLRRETAFYGNRFDAVHASPPCQAFSSASKGNGTQHRHPDLITPLRPMLEMTEIPYVIENVPGAPLRSPIQLCGSSFGLGVRRHRLFETNWSLHGLPCTHWKQPAIYDIYEHGKWFKSACARVYGSGGGKAREHWGTAMGIDWMTHDELRESIPPAYTEFIGGELMNHLNGIPPAHQTIFDLA